MFGPIKLKFAGQFFRLPEPNFAQTNQVSLHNETRCLIGDMPILICVHFFLYVKREINKENPQMCWNTFFVCVLDVSPVTRATQTYILQIRSISRISSVQQPIKTLLIQQERYKIRIQTRFLRSVILMHRKIPPYTWERFSMAHAQGTWNGLFMQRPADHAAFHSPQHGTLQVEASSWWRVSSHLLI
jgi:hypothetical protein